MSHLISNSRAQSFSMHKWLCDPIFSQWIVENICPFGKSVLDVGCGNGFMFDYYKKKFKKVAGIDPSPSFLPQLQREISKGNVEFQHAPAENIPYTDKCFDVVIAKSSLHHFDDVKKGISEMQRVSKNAIVVIEVVSPSEICLPFLSSILTYKEKERASTSIYSLNSLKKVIVENTSYNQIFLNLFDQYIDINSWIEYSDLDNEQKQFLLKKIILMDDDVKKAMQFHRRKNHYYMIRRMCMCIAFDNCI